jgi:hypothetical protein
VKRLRLITCVPGPFLSYPSGLNLHGGCRIRSLELLLVCCTRKAGGGGAADDDLLACEAHATRVHNLSQWPRHGIRVDIHKHRIMNVRRMLKGTRAKRLDVWRSCVYTDALRHDR